MRILDSAIALRIVYLLATPIERTDAFKQGLIDKDGKTIRKAESLKEKNATSALHRLVWNLKRLISLVPGGSTRVGSLAAAYMLMKEAYTKEWTDEQLAEEFVQNFSSIDTGLVEEELNTLFDQLEALYEDAPANSAGAMPDSGGVAKSDPKLFLAKRKKFKAIEFAKGEI